MNEDGERAFPEDAMDDGGEGAEENAGARTALPAELATELRRRILEEPGFMRVTQVARRGGQVRRVSLRPVQVKGIRQFQQELTLDGRVVVRNTAADAAAELLEPLLAQKGARELHLVTASGDLHLRVTRKGKVLVSRSKPLARTVEEAPAHDHVKRQPLQTFEAAPLLRVLGLTDGEGRIRASLRGKYDQVNEFLRLCDGVVADRPAGSGPLVLADCGCGRAYLTLAAYFYLTRHHGLDVQVRGIERNEELVATARRMAQDLDVAQDVQFLAADLATCHLEERPEVVLSLHACDTATDEALARGVEWGSRVILCAPCCQHELQGGLQGGGPMRAVLRHGILRERLADILADTFRAQILRILGYRVTVMEFVAPDATARNLMLRAEYCVKPGQPQAIGEYLDLRDWWQVRPWLETRLAARLERHLARMATLPPQAAAAGS